MNARKASERRDKRRQQLLEIAARRCLDAAADEGRGVLERPDELIDLLHDLDRQLRRISTLRHQEDWNLLVAVADVVEQPSRFFVSFGIVVVEQPVHQHTVDRGVGRNDGHPVGR